MTNRFKFDETNLIAQAVFPLKAKSVAMSEAEAIKQIEYVTAELAKANGELNVCAPRANSNMRRDDYARINNYHYFVKSITKEDETKPRSYRMNDPEYRVMCDMGCAKLIDDAREAAKQQYEMYVYKLIGKVGEVVTAKLEGSSVWFESFLNIETVTGEKQVWKTICICNVSKLGKVFNQFPTRRMKK